MIWEEGEENYVAGLRGGGPRMSVVKRGKKHAVVHCKGEDKGKVIATHGTRAEALAQHRAIKASQVRRRKHNSAEEGSFLEERKRRFGIE